MIAGYEDPLRTEAAGGSERQGGMDSIAPGDIIGSGHHSPLPASHDDRLAAQRRIQVLLHRGKEGVEIEVGNDPIGSMRPLG